MAHRLILLLIAVTALSARADDRTFKWKLIVNSKETEIGEEATTIKVGAWDCHVDHVWLDSFDNQLRTVWCGVGNDEKGSTDIVCCFDKKTKRAKYTAGMITLRQKKASGTKHVSLSCE